MITLLRNLIKRCRVALSYPDVKNFPYVQVEFNGKTIDVEVIMPYGLAARIPVDALGHKILLNADEGDQAAIFNTPTLRFKDLAEGEVALGNPLSGSVVYFRENGDIQVVGKNNMTMTIDAAMVITAASGLTINADVTINGDVVIPAGKTLSVDGIDFGTHVHGGIEPGAGTSGGPQ